MALLQLTAKDRLLTMCARFFFTEKYHFASTIGSSKIDKLPTPQKLSEHLHLSDRSHA
jgi:hypothetical protein